MLVDIIPHGNYTIEIHTDDNPESPREWCNLGTMVCSHRRYNLGDIHNGSMDDVPDDSIKLTLTLYDHSGISMSTSDSSYPFDCPWDAGQVGVIYCTREKALAEYGAKRMTKALREKVIKVLKQEVDTYDQFLRGDVYGYIVKDSDGVDMDSCWGFYGMDDVTEQAKEACKHIEPSYAI